MSETPKPRIMVADDETRVRAVIRKVMAAMGAEVVAEAVNGEEAVNLYRTEKPDILLLDVRMPVKDGKETLVEIKDRYPNAFVIMLSSLKDKEVADECLRLGAAHFIRKDTNIQEIKKLFKAAWEDYKQQKGPA